MLVISSEIHSQTNLFFPAPKQSLITAFLLSTPLSSLGCAKALRTIAMVMEASSIRQRYGVASTPMRKAARNSLPGPTKESPQPRVSAFVGAVIGSIAT
jgi:hypothetical protein